MSTKLIEALQELHLQPGQTYTVRVGGELLEIRKPVGDEPSVYSGHVMLLPWFESPDPSAGTVTARRGELPPNDPPILPDEYEGDE